MDFGGVRLAPAAAVATAATRVEPQGVGMRAVATELPKEETVREAQQAEAVRVDVQGKDAREQMARERLLRDFIKNRAFLDPRTREVVFQSVNSRTGEVIRQFPDDITLRIRDYVSFMAEARAKVAAPSDRRVNNVA
jgi:uncharacterized FlaG/YvyC family protein